MKSRWSEEEADAFVARYGNHGHDLALRVYSARLLGRDPRLVLHGGGNSSVKTEATDILGERVPVLCVKGSGWDMADIELPGFPAVRLEPLRKLRALERLSDEDMVNFQRTNLLDSAAPNPSVETLLHAFLPHKFVDHTHSAAVLALTDQPDGEAICRDAFAGRAGIVPYVMPGFALAKRTADIFDRSPAVEALILLKHGIFTFGDNARQSYERMIAMVAVAEQRLARGRPTVFAAVALPLASPAVADVAPLLRGITAISTDSTTDRSQPQILRFRSSPQILNYVNGAELARYSQVGVVTPDHAIRTKAWPLMVPAPEAGKLGPWTQAAKESVRQFTDRYRAYFETYDTGKKQLDPMPRVVLVPGLGLFGLGASAKEADIAADIAENTIGTVTAAEAIGRFESIAESDMFDVEYWSLEQAKLGKGAAPGLARHVVAVTGGASGIGAATARAFAKEGAEVTILDREISEAGAGRVLGIECDVTNAEQVRAAFDRIAESFGGVDIVVSNAGGAWQGEIGTVDDETLRRSFELNFFAHQHVAQNAVRIMKAQGLGGCLLFNVSKQAVNPGRNFGPYGLPKSATLALTKQYALDHGGDGIRANAINADRVRTGLVTDAMIAERAKARGISEQDYMTGNLLRREVTPEDVADAFVFLARARKTTAAILTVDGGNIEASLR